MISLAQYYTNKNQRTRINSIIKESFADANGVPKEAHELIASLPITDIWTTNYDTLIERALKQQDILTTIITDDESYRDVDNRAKVKIYKIHGTVSQASKCVITRSDYEAFSQKHDIVLSELKGAMCSKSFLFLGYSFSDTDIQHILTKIRLIYNKEQPQRHYCIVEKLKKSDYSKEEDYNYDVKKQEHHISDIGDIVYHGDSSYILSVKWKNFIGNPTQYIEKAYKIQNSIEQYDICFEVEMYY